MRPGFEPAMRFLKLTVSRLLQAYRTPTYCIAPKVPEFACTCVGEDGHLIDRQCAETFYLDLSRRVGSNELSGVVYNHKRESLRY